MREGRKRLSVDLPLELHKKVEQLASTRNITITKYVIRAILKKVREEEQYRQEKS